MPKVHAFLHGVYPRSDVLAQATRDLDRKRITPSDVAKQQAKDGAILAAVQKEANFAYLEDGKLNWQDIFRPIIQATSGMEVGPLTRWFDNNSFYRQPIITGKLTVSAKKLDDYFIKPTSGQWKVTLASPFTFAKLLDDTTTKSFEKTLTAITKLYEEIFSYLNEKKVSLIQLNEPYIPYHKVKKAEIALLGKSLTQLKKAKGKALLAVNGYFGDTAALATTLAGNNAVDILGIDFTFTAINTLPKKLTPAIIAGVVDGRNSLLEEKETIVNFVTTATKHFGDTELYLSNNSDLDLLPEAVAKKKAALLGEVVKHFA
ncbi:MAG: hypothetical protein ACRDF4_04065 [Rhabdochlamydiaceae bacterium]